MNEELKLNKLFDTLDFRHKDLFEGINYPWEAIKGLNDYIAEKTGESKVKLGENSTVEEGALINGPAIIGNNVVIRHGAYLRENVLIGDNVVIGHAVELKNCIIMNNTFVPHFNYVADSILGQNVNMGAGSITANWRFDKVNVLVKGIGGSVDSGLEKLGAFVGDGSNIGVNAVLNPGTVLGKGSVVYPLVSVTGYHPDNSVIK